MRVFAALPLPDHVVADLHERLDVVVPEPRTGLLRWTAPSSWHLTLAFFGSMTDDDVADLRRRLRRTARRHAAFTVSLAGSGHFGRRVVWTGVTGEVEPIRRLARSVGAAGRRAGADVDEQGTYRPHLTLARAPTPRDPDDSASIREAVTGAVERLRDYSGPTWTASTFTLVRSEPGKGEGRRSRHTVLETFRLAGRPTT